MICRAMCRVDDGRVVRLLATGMILVGVHAAHAENAAAMAGDYVCKSDCHRSDAPPNIEIDGTIARCRSDLGGVFSGTVLSGTSVACFNMIGTLSHDGKAIVWSNGGVWERRR